MTDVSSEKAIWRMLDRVRGKMPTSEFGVALAALIFLRWADFEEAEREAIAAFDDVEYEPVLPFKFHWRSWCDLQPDDLQHTIRELPSALNRFANSRHDAMATQLHRVSPAVDKLSRFPTDVLADMIRWLAHQPFETPTDRRALRDVLDFVLQNTHDKFAGQFYTPIQIAALMVEMVKPKFGESVYDPCFGSAGLLTAALDVVEHRENVTLGKATYTSAKLPLQLAGVEINTEAFVIGMTRLVLSGVNDPQLEHGNSLERLPASNPNAEGFDIVLANPPWGMKVDLYGMDHYPIPTKDSSSLFLQHAISQLRPGGRGVMVVPPSLLFRSGREQQLREWLLQENTVEAIVSIPRGAFAPHTSIETCLMMFRRGGTTRSIRMVNSESIFEKADKSQIGAAPFVMASQLGHHIRATEPGRDWWDVDVSDLAEIDYDLTPKRRDRSGLELILDSLPEETEVRLLKDCCTVVTGRSIRSDDLQANRPNSQIVEKGQGRSDMLPLEELEFRMQELESAMASLGNTDHEVGEAAPNDIQRNEMLKEFTELQAQLLQHESDLTRGQPSVPYVRIRDVEKGIASRGSSWVKPLVAASLQPNWKLRAGDILLSKSGTIGKAGIVRNGAVGGVAASGFFVLRVKEGTIDPHYLLAFIQCSEANAWLEDRARGAAAKHLSVAAVKELPVVLPPLQIQQRTAEQHRKFGVDALTYLAELLSEDDSDSLASELNDWVSRNLKCVESYEGDAASLDVLELLERVADSECPVNICRECNHPYHLDYSTHYLESLENYSAGISTHCLACWLDVGPGSDTIESLSDQTPLVPWALSFSDATQALANVSKIPDPVGVLNVLQTVKVNLTQSSQSIDGHLPNVQRARDLTSRLAAVTDSYCEHLGNEVKIVVNVVDAIQHPEDEYEVRLTVENIGRLPIRDVQFSFNPPMPAIEPSFHPYFSSKQSVELTFRGRNQWYSDDQITALRWSNPEWSLNWTARTLSGRSIADKRELGLHFRDEQEEDAEQAIPLGGSPYITGNPVQADRNDVFFGRDGLLEDIRSHIVRSGNVAFLDGNKRAGKSSILLHLTGVDVIPGWIGVFASIQGTEGDSESKAAGVPTVEVFRTIAIETAKSIQRNLGLVLLPDGSELQRGKPGVVDIVREAIKSDAPFTYFREYIELLLGWLQDRDLRLLILLDEFDTLQRGIDSGITSPQVAENLRFLFQSQTRLTAILTSMRRLRRIREEYFSALYGIGTPFDVSSLSEEDAQRLVTEPVKGQITYAKNAISRAVHLAARQPYLLQCLCESVFCTAKTSGIRSITIDHVNDAAKDVLKNRHFNDLFKYAGSDQRRFILAMGHREADGPDPLRLPVIREKLSAHGIEVPEEDLAADLEWLTDLELLDFSGAQDGESYSLSVPLMGLWIDTLDYTGLMSKARAENSESEDNDNE